MSVRDLKTGKDFWVSMAGDRNDNRYLIGYVYPREKNRLLRFGKPKTKRWFEIYLTKDKYFVKNCFNPSLTVNMTGLKMELENLKNMIKWKPRI